MKTKIKGILDNILPVDPLASNTRVQSIMNEIPKDSSILDIGCVNHSLDDDDQNWLHGQLAASFDEIIGLDFLEDEVEQMRSMGYNVKQANAETFSLDDTYDVVVAGELIEHLSNCGKFLDRANEHLNNDGKLILTTPNPWYLFNVLAVYAGTASWNEEHTTWYDYIVLEELLGRHGFKIKKVDYVRPSPWKWMFFHKNIERYLTYPFWMLGLERMSGNRYLIVAQK